MMNIEQEIQNILDRNFTRGDNANALKELLVLYNAVEQSENTKKIDMSTNDELKNETANGTKPVLAVVYRLSNSDKEKVVSEDKRQLPFLIQCPNGLEVHPSIKMKFENYGSSLFGDKLEAMMVTWRD